jgi:peroxiredoxin
VTTRYARSLRTLAACLLIALPALATTGSSSAAPDFRLASRAGKAVALSDFRGNVVMLNFWATWCGPCRQEMPLLESIHKKYAKLGFTLIGVNVEPDSRAADDWLKKHAAVTFPIVYDTDSRVSKLYKVAGMPSSVIVDRKGVVRVVHKGYKPGDENAYLDHIRALIRE